MCRKQQGVKAQPNETEVSEIQRGHVLAPPLSTDIEKVSGKGINFHLPHSSNSRF